MAVTGRVKQLVDPRRVGDVGLADRDVLHVRRVHQHHLEVGLRAENTGAQYTPVASMATSVMVSSASHVREQGELAALEKLLLDV